MTIEQIITVSASGIFTVISAVIAATSIRKYKKQKSYDLFTVKRLRTYDCIQKTYQELIAISSIDYINMATEVSCEKYLADYELTLSKLFGTLSTTEKQEYYLLKEYSVLQKLSKEYATSKTAEVELRLEEQRKRIKYFTDIYLWALWDYVQRLHIKNSEDEYHDFYEQQFKQIFERSKDLNASESTFFRDYRIDMLIDHCAVEEKCRKRRCKNRRNK